MNAPKTAFVKYGYSILEVEVIEQLSHYNYFVNISGRRELASEGVDLFFDAVLAYSSLQVYIIKEINHLKSQLSDCRKLKLKGDVEMDDVINRINTRIKELKTYLDDAKSYNA